MLKRTKRVPLATSLKTLEPQAEAFLAEYGFPVNDRFKGVFGAFVQHLPQDQDWFDPNHMAATLRKAQATEAAFYLIRPDKRKELDEQAAVESTPDKVEEKA